MSSFNGLNDEMTERYFSVDEHKLKHATQRNTLPSTMADAIVKALAPLVPHINKAADVIQKAAAPLAPQLAPVLAASEKAFQPVLAFAGKYKDLVAPAQLEMGLIGVFALAGLLKVVAPGGMKKQFPFYPGWIYPLLGLFQLLTAAFMYVDKWEVAAPMAYVFLGGALYSNLRVMPPSIVFPALSVLATFFAATNAKQDTADWVLLGSGLGFVVALILSMLGSGAPADKEKTQ